MRGRKLVLNYTNGSPCEDASREHASSMEDLFARRIADNDNYEENSSYDDAEDADKDRAKQVKKLSSGVRRKSTVISMLCDKDPLAPKLTLSFVGSPDECSYFFEGRSPAACATLNKSKGTLNPGGVFVVIVIIAMLVYLVGGCVYNRAVLQQRGWSQVPNYHLWASILGFVKVSLYRSGVGERF